MTGQHDHWNEQVSKQFMEHLCGAYAYYGLNETHCKDR